MTIGCVPRGRVTVAAGLFVEGCTVVFTLGWTPYLGPTLSGAAAPKAPPQPAECC
nr:hypothetical protein [Rhodococcus sp. F64268]